MSASKKTIKKTPKKTSVKSSRAASSKSASLTIRIDPQMAGLLDKLGHAANKSRSDIAREALRRHLLLAEFESLRRRAMPYAEAQGFLTDEDVFAVVS